MAELKTVITSKGSGKAFPGLWAKDLVWGP